MQQNIRSKDKILKKVRNALNTQQENPFLDVDHESPVYKALSDSLDISFAQEFSKVSGQFVFCENETELANNLKLLIRENGWRQVYCADSLLQNFLEHANISFCSKEEDFLNMEAGITRCEYLIARLGSIMVSSASLSGRRLNVFPPAHIVIADTSQLVPDIIDAMKALKLKYGNNLPSMVSLITGPSRTADIEKTLVMGAHGPKELYVLLLDKSNSNG